MRCGGAAMVVVVMGVLVIMLLVETEAWGSVASLPEAEERLQRLQASAKLLQAGAQDDRNTLHLPVQLPTQSSMNHSVVSLAFLAFGALLFDFLGGIFLTRTHQSREMLLPGLGLLGDALNNLAEVALNSLTIYLYREESPDCSERLLCESSQQAGQRGLLDKVVNYLSGFLVSLFLPERSLSRSLEAMRAGRRGGDCVDMYPRCSIKL